jgi:hypothetical protein
MLHRYSLFRSLENINETRKILNKKQLSKFFWVNKKKKRFMLRGVEEHSFEFTWNFIELELRQPLHDGKKPKEITVHGEKTNKEKLEHEEAEREEKFSFGGSCCFANCSVMLKCREREKEKMLLI